MGKLAGGEPGNNLAIERDSLVVFFGGVVVFVCEEIS